MQRKLPVTFPDEVIPIDATRMHELDTIELWVSFLYHHAPGWVWNAIMGIEGKNASRLREDMTRYEKEH